MTQVLERGHVFFLSRPKVEHERVEGLDDVQRLFLVLRRRPAGACAGFTSAARSCRPRAGRAAATPGATRTPWCATERGLGEDAKREEYETKTRGHRVQPEDRPVGEGVYALVREGEETQLVVALELPREPGEAPEAMNLRKEASYVVSVKNPRAGDRGQPRAPLQAELPEELQARFAGARFIPADPPELLDHPGVELLLMPVSPGATPDVDLPTGPEAPESAELFSELGLEPGETPTDALQDGRWG